MALSSSSSPSSSDKLYVVSVDTRGYLPGHWAGYVEMKCKPSYFQDNIVNDPKIVCFQSPIAALCGRNIKVYFKKYRKGLGQIYKTGGERALMSTLASNPDLLARNNGAASFLTLDIDNGLPNYTIEGKAYMVQDDGHYPLSQGQVWGIMEMVHCAVDIYDMDPESMRRGKQTLTRWSEKYKNNNQTFEPPSGCGGIDIYSDRSA